MARRRLELGQQELDMLRARYRDRMISLIRAAQQSARLVAVATFSFRVRQDNVPPAASAEAAWMLYNARATYLTIVPDLSRPLTRTMPRSGTRRQSPVLS